MASKITYPSLPIIYVRGFAATMSEIDQTTADPYMGFNRGTALLRQNAAKKPVRFIFESPLLRLMKDHGYVDAFHHGGDSYDPGTASAQSIWIFRRERMREYLKLPKDSANVNDLDGAFPVERCFCLVGSDHKDYDAFFGLSRKGTGAMSDGLVMMENAYVQGAPRAVTYNSHSGAYGIVNSESGYQNLRRFLFGQQRITAMLEVEALPLAKPVQEKLTRNSGSTSTSKASCIRKPLPSRCVKAPSVTVSSR